MKMSEAQLGVFYAVVAYIIWGLFPIYWKLLQSVSPGEILANRILWSFLFMIGLVLLTKRWPGFIQECKDILHSRKKLFGITLASIIISVNWLTYIWAVNNGHVIESSLGYYINPIVTILLGVIFLREKLTRAQIIASILAAIGVLYSALHFGSVPWVALILASSFGLYGLLKKTVRLDAMFGLTIETLIVAPIALLYIGTTQVTGSAVFLTSPGITLLLIGGGLTTAVPLLLFANGAKRISLTAIGFLQYIAPTMILFLGVFLYGEAFTTVDLISFSFIWLGLLIYGVSNMKSLRGMKRHSKTKVRA